VSSKKLTFSEHPTVDVLRVTEREFAVMDELPTLSPSVQVHVSCVFTLITFPTPTLTLRLLLVLPPVVVASVYEVPDC
jgi:hypothetical protein